MNTKVPEKELAAGIGQQAARRNDLRRKAYPPGAFKSTESLKEEIGLLLWFLCSRISEKQSAAGWALLEVLYKQYLSAKSGSTQ
jgi:hypothetical protein